MSHLALRIKNQIKSTGIGKKLRDLYQMRSFTAENAKKTLISVRGELPEEQMKALVQDMLKEARKYRFSFGEYLMFHFDQISFEKRRTFVADRERISYCERMNNMKNMIIFDDKAATYRKYQKYYHRDMIEVKSINDYAVFSKFTDQHERFIVKPFDGACGRGIQILSAEQDRKGQLQELCKQYANGFVAEELIVQAEEMSQFHRESVNTLRMPTIRFDDRIEIIHPFWRIGRGNSVVDNAGSGGIACAIDVETGKVIAAADEKGNQYTVHPDSGVQLIGFQLPRWDEAKAMAKELAMVLPDNRYTGWDFALTDQGWILQEANDRGGFINFQLPTQTGFRSEIEAIMRELNV